MTAQNTPSWSPQDILSEEPAPTKPTAGKPKQDRATLVLLLVAAMVAIGGIGFALGHTLAPTSTTIAAPSGRGGFTGRNFASLAPGQTFAIGQFGAGAAGINGTVQSINGSTMIIKETNGNVVTVNLTNSTIYQSEVSANQSQVGVGTNVTIQIDTTPIAGETPNASATGAVGGRTLTAKNVLITTP
jgi:hypothetical protein